MTDKWTDWFNINDNCNYQGPAVYKVRLANANSNACKLERLLMADDEGIMCIGQTGNMERRRTKFLSGIKNANGHSEINLVYYLNRYTKFPDKFNDANFQYSFCKCSDVPESKKEEDKLIKAYFKEFGEVPPLNSAIPNRYEGWKS
ncbi:MAG: hypothetical protein ABSA64_09990 [Sedimentisphaerales bacterium]|jgi:hypothetical protein